MRESHLRALMRAEFGPGYAASVARDQVLTSLGGRTAEQALGEGEPPARVWEALCRAMDVPAHRHLGADPELPPAGSRHHPEREAHNGHHGTGRGVPHPGGRP